MGPKGDEMKQSNQFRDVHPKNFTVQHQVATSLELSQYLNEIGPKLIRILQDKGIQIEEKTGMAGLYREGIRQLIIKELGEDAIPEGLSFQPSRRLPEFCINGHQYVENDEDGKRSYYVQNGKRICRKCHNIRVSESTGRRKSRERIVLPPLNDTYLAQAEKIESLRLAAATAYRQLATAAVQSDKRESANMARAIQDILAEVRSMPGPSSDIAAIEQYVKSVAD